MHTRESLHTFDVQNFNKYTNNKFDSSIDIGRHEIHYYLVYPSISYFARTKQSRSFVLPFRASAHNNNDTPVVTYNSTSVYNGYIRAHIYIHIYIHLIYIHREFELLYSGIISRFESRCDPFSRLSTQRTCSPCYFGKHLMLIEPLSLFAPRTLPNVASSPPSPLSTKFYKPPL